jgi:hypothetical protein
MDTLELQLLALLDGEPVGPPQDPACGAVSHDKAAGVIDVPICDIGIIKGAAQSAGAQPVRLLAVDPEAQPGAFVFVVEKPRVYLPIVLRSRGKVRWEGALHLRGATPLRQIQRMRGDSNDP